MGVSSFSLNVRRAGAGSEARAPSKKINRFTSERPLGLAQTLKVWIALQIPQKLKMRRVLEVTSRRILFAVEYALLVLQRSTLGSWVEDPVLS